MGLLVIFFGSIINVGVGRKKSIKKRALILNACYNRKWLKQSNKRRHQNKCKVIISQIS